MALSRESRIWNIHALTARSGTWQETTELVGKLNRTLAGSEFVELVFAQLEQANIRPGALLGVETGLDPGNRFHEIEIQTESVGSALDLLDRRSDRGVLE